MTLILALGNQDQFIQVSDRRLTSAGALVDDESNKAIYLHCANARLAVGFSGLARSGEFVTRDWLLDALIESGREVRGAKEILEGLTESATECFNESPQIKSLPKKNRRLSILCSGYLDHHEPPLMCYAIISNYHDFGNLRDHEEALDHFQLKRWSEKRPATDEPSMIQYTGFWQSITQMDIDALRQLVVKRIPRENLIARTVALVREVAERPKSHGLIGPHLSSISIPRNSDEDPVSGFHPSIAKTVYVMTDMIDCSVGWGIKDIQMKPTSNEAPALVIPKAKQHQPCPCGSGKKYRDCHGMRGNRI